MANPAWFKAESFEQSGELNESSELHEAVPNQLSALERTENNPVLQSVLDVLVNESDREKANELYRMHTQWRNGLLTKSGGNPMIAQDHIVSFVKSLEEVYSSDDIKHALLFHVYVGSTIDSEDALKNSGLYTLDLVGENGGVFENEIRKQNSVL